MGHPNGFLPIWCLLNKHTRIHTENNREINKDREKETKERKRETRGSCLKRVDTKGYIDCQANYSPVLMNVFLQLKSGLRLSSFLFRFSILMFSFFSFPQMLACLLAQKVRHRHQRKKEREREREERWHYNTCLKLSKKEGRGNAWMVNKWTLIDFFFLGGWTHLFATFLAKLFCKFFLSFLFCQFFVRAKWGVKCFMKISVDSLRIF